LKQEGAMKKNLLLQVFFVIYSVELAGCAIHRAQAEEKGEKNPAEDARKAKIVAKVNGQGITVGEVEEKISVSAEPAKYENKEEMKKLIDSLIEERLLEQEAIARGYDKLPKVVDGVKRVLQNLMQTKYVEENLTLDSISKDEAMKYYEEHNTDYNQPALIRASQIVVSDEAKAKSLLMQCKAKDFDLRQFRQLATDNSEDELTKKRGGDLRYFDITGKVWYSDEKVPVEVAKAAFSIEVKMRASVIVFQDRDSAEKVLKELMSGKQDDATFVKAVKKYSVDEATKAKGGDVGWFNMEGNLDGKKVVSDKISSVAFTYQTTPSLIPRVIEADGKFYIVRTTSKDDPGSLYPDIVKTDKGYHIIWIVNRRPAISKTYEEVEYSIKQRLFQDKKMKFIDDMVDKLMKKYNVQIFEKNLDKVVIDLSGVPPAAKAQSSK